MSQQNFSGWCSYICDAVLIVQRELQGQQFRHLMPKTTIAISSKIKANSHMSRTGLMVSRCIDTDVLEVKPLPNQNTHPEEC